MTHSLRAAGFTLVEILVSVAVIGIILSITVFTTRGSLEAARDTQRKSELKQYQAALEGFANRNNGFFPVSISVARISSTHCGTLGLSNCAEDPKYAQGDTTWAYYSYITDSGGTVYVLWAKLESLPAGVTTQYWVVCSNGKSAVAVSAPTTSTCPI